MKFKQYQALQGFRLSRGTLKLTAEEAQQKGKTVVAVEGESGCYSIPARKEGEPRPFLAIEKGEKFYFSDEYAIHESVAHVVSS
ncbi:MAG: hypothetical protein JKY93_00480 [Gammaproteobacteria bacterium]|nr:hypothetical protein [Gammaproteobacteria bacterium]